MGGDRRTARYLRTFADAEPGELLLYEDAAGVLALAVNGGEAAAELGGVAPGDEIRLHRRDARPPAAHLRAIGSTNRRAASSPGRARPTARS